MTRREKELERALEGLDRTGDEELDALVDTADDLSTRFSSIVPSRPEGRAMFIEGVTARKRSFVSSLAAPGIAVAAFLVFLAVLGRGAAPGESLYPVRNVLRSAGLAEAPTVEIDKEVDDASLALAQARSSFDEGPRVVERLAAAALMSLGRAEGYLDQVGAGDRALFEDRIAALRLRALSLIRMSATDDDLESDDSSGPGSDEGDDDNSGPGSGSDDSSDDNSGSGSDDSDDDSSGSGSDDSGSGDSSGSGSGGGDSSGSGSGGDD